MSKMGEILAQALNRLFPPLKMHRELRRAKASVAANQRWAYEEALRIYPYFSPYWDYLFGKTILDLGTGLGGKLPFYIESGARFVFGVDIDEEAISLAQAHIQSLGLSKRVLLVTADAAALPFCNDTFDAIISINTFEHIAMVEQALHECYRVLRPGGFAFLFLPPYYSPWGPHLELWIHFPWPHLLFSEKTLMRIAAREDARLRMSSEFANLTPVQWDADCVPNVNRITLQRFRSILSKTDFSIKQIILLPVGYEFLRSRKSLKPIFFAMRMMTSLPLLQEVVVTKISCVLQKPSDGK